MIHYNHNNDSDNNLSDDESNYCCHHDVIIILLLHQSHGCQGTLKVIWGGIGTVVGGLLRSY